MVEPGDVGNDLRVDGIGTEGGHQHRGSAVHGRPSRPPHALARKWVRKDRFDRRRPRYGALTSLLRRPRLRDTDDRQPRELRPTLRRCLPPTVIDVLDLVHEPVSVVCPQPLDAPDTKRQARGLKHRRRVGVKRRREHDEQHNERDQPSPPAPAPDSGAPSRDPLRQVSVGCGDEVVGSRLRRIRRRLHVESMPR